MTSHLFGGVWCSSCACYAPQRAVQHPDCDPEVKYVVLRSFYVADLLLSMNNNVNAVGLIDSVTNVLSLNGFTLSKFTANDMSLLNNVCFDDRHVAVDQLVTISDSKALGTLWDNRVYCFYFKINVIDRSFVTRRSILSFVASIFDPVGLISPIIVAGKVIFQQTTRLTLSWDTPVPDYICMLWCNWLDTLSQLGDIKISRCLIPA